MRLCLNLVCKALFEETIPAFDVLGKKSFFLGQVGNGAKMKLIVNMIMGRYDVCLSHFTI